MRSGWLTLIMIIVVTTVSAWIATSVTRRRMRQALGRKVEDAELTSITTWMKVDETERRGQGDKVVPHSPREMSPEGFEGSGFWLGRVIRKAKRAAEETADKVEDVVDDVSE